MAECGERVGGGTITFPCSLDEGHRGPHYAVENPRSVSQRRRWEQEAEAARRVLAGHGGRPMNFAENIGEGPGSPVPGSNLQPAEYRAASPGSASPPGNKPVPTAEGPEMRWPSEDSTPVDSLIAQVAHPPEPDEHEQSLPITNARPSIQGLLIADIEARTQIGIKRYGTPLQPFNGRSSTRDAFEEALDLATYLRQVEFEKVELAERLGAIMKEGFMYTPGDEGLIADLFIWLTA